MYALQPRLEQPRGKRALRLLEQPRFRAAFDLLALRAQLGLAPPEIAAWWTQLQEVAPERAPAALMRRAGDPRALQRQPAAERAR